MKEWCGEERPSRNDLTACESAVYIELHTDASNHDRGFNLWITAKKKCEAKLLSAKKQSWVQMEPLFTDAREARPKGTLKLIAKAILLLLTAAKVNDCDNLPIIIGGVLAGVLVFCVVVGLVTCGIVKCVQLKKFGSKVSDDRDVSNRTFGHLV